MCSNANSTSTRPSSKCDTIPVVCPSFLSAAFLIDATQQLLRSPFCDRRLVLLIQLAVCCICPDWLHANSTSCHGEPNRGQLATALCFMFSVGPGFGCTFHLLVLCLPFASINLSIYPSPYMQVVRLLVEQLKADPDPVDKVPFVCLFDFGVRFPQRSVPHLLSNGSFMASVPLCLSCCCSGRCLATSRVLQPRHARGMPCFPLVALVVVATCRGLGCALLVVAVASGRRLPWVLGSDLFRHCAFAID